MRSFAPLLALLALAACGGDAPAGREQPPAAATPPAPAGWQSNPEQGITLRGAEPLVIETGPHLVAWPAPAPALRPPYRVEASFHKRSGRLSEGYGLVFGGEALSGPEAQQHYSYFLVRGDGSFLVKRRDGAQTPVVRDWTAHPAVQRDRDGAGLPQRLAVQVGAEEVVFYVNDTEVTRVPAAELRTEGVAGVRSAHGLVLEVTGFRAAAAGTPAVAP